jgi:PBSX family phage portal protein
MNGYQQLADAGKNFLNLAVNQLNNALKPKTTSSFMISFGDPEPVLSSAVVNFGSFLNMAGEYYLPPVSFHGLTKLLGANPYHAPILHLKKNLISLYHKPNKIMSYSTLNDSAFDFLTYGNSFYQDHLNGFGKTVRLSRLPALNMRKHRTKNVYIQLLPVGLSQNSKSYIEYAEGEVLHIKETDVGQDYYGVPQYAGGIQSILLSEAATLFRRKYYINGAHLGYILVTHDANIDNETRKQIEDNVRAGKGAGNFRSLYMNVTKSSSREPVKVIPIGDIGTKDEFQRIKEVTEMEMCAMHRMYPSLAAIIPANVGGFGNINDTFAVYKEIELTPMQQRFLLINEMLNKDVVVFG